jgi:hypothetical protein
MLNLKKTTLEDYMDEQENKLEEQTPDTEHQPEAQEHQPEAQEEQVEKLKETTEKIWGSTKHAWNTATFKASQYKNLVQKKIDQSAIHKKIHVAHGDLGKMIDDLREAGKKSIMNQAAVKETLTRIDELKAEAVALEEEVEKLRTEGPPQEDVHEDEKNE